MNKDSARYAKEGDTLILQLSGNVRHPLAPALDALLNTTFADSGLTRYLIDLNQAESIDSTCLGILAGIANHLAQRGEGKPLIVSSNPDITELLRVVCFDQQFHILGGDSLETTEPKALDTLAVDEREMLDLVLSAHRRLCAIDERNRTVFQDLVTALEAEQRQGKDG
ncbi:STAS domain-containing protein [Sedimenticola hydrogenitrophicus]|uniref:STAS domain-containing protein n=1 Tax=Sedimenticola hydrogenitrophicus TaxID=2967975 RepID=UPI0021A7294F|nr:STAS domain-containing protein [Sedimenticola hydrogenitrophicus]